MKKAFTIVELLVVMAIIGILLTLAVVGIQQLQKQQRMLAIQNDLKNFSGVIQNCYGRYRFYPFYNHNNPAQKTFRTDTEGTVRGFCLIHPSQSASFSSLMATSSGCSIEDKDSYPQIFNVIPISAFGFNGGIIGWEKFYMGSAKALCDDATTNHGVVFNADSWGIAYAVNLNVASPQEYILGACTESGPITN